MTVIIFCDTKNCEYKRARERILSDPSLSAVIGRTENRSGKERAPIYQALSDVYPRIFKKPLPNLEYTELGAPYFPGEDIKISISHRQGMSTLVLSDMCVGVDIEEKVDEMRAKRLDGRMLTSFGQEKISHGAMHLIDYDENSRECESYEKSAIIPVYVSRECDCDIVAIGRNCVNKYLQINEIESREPFEVRWTLLEAYLKAEGGGFASYPACDGRLSLYSAASFSILHRDTGYTLSLVMR